MPPPENANPTPIWASATTWDLEAAPTTLQDVAGQLRARTLRALSAQTTVDDSAVALISNEYWAGDSADLYQSHRRRLTGDLGELATRLGDTAEALDQIAAVLIYCQAALDQEWAKISAIPHPRSGRDLRFQPATEAEAALVRGAMSAAADIRSTVDEELVLKESTLHTARQDLVTISDTWQPRSLRVLDLNVGQGFGNVPWPDSDREDGTDHGDIDEIGQTIADSGADVVTLQEMFDGDAGKLREWLEENTGDTWELHFAAADHKIQWDDSVMGDGSIRPFGNAILVRLGDGIADSDELDEVTLQEPGPAGIFNVGPEGRSMEGARIEFEDD